MVQLFYTTYISVDLSYHELFHAKIGMGGIEIDISLWILLKLSCICYGQTGNNIPTLNIW